MKKIISINMDQELWEKLKELAPKENRSASNLLETLVKKYLEEKGK